MTFKEQLKLAKQEQRAAEKRARKQQQREQVWSAAQAQRQMEFQERMSSTAHQREMADLQAAGLNPVLTATGGSGASAPSGAMADSSSMLSSIQSIASAIPSMAAAAESSAKAVKTVVRRVGKGSSGSNNGTEQDPNNGANTGVQNLGEVESANKPEPYDFGNDHLNQIYQTAGEKPLGDTGFTVGEAMITANEVINMFGEVGRDVGAAIADAAEKAGKGDWNKLPEKEKETVASYLARHSEVKKNYMTNTYYRESNSGSRHYLRMEDMQLDNALYKASKTIQKAGIDRRINKAGIVKKYHNRYHAIKSP